MNTLTLSPDLDPKGHSRKRYEKRHTVRQDHGTRGTGRVKDQDISWDQSAQNRMNRFVTLEQLSAASPAQLEKAANMILRVSDAEINEAYALNEEISADIAEEIEAEHTQSEEGEMDRWGDEWSAEAYMLDQDELRQEIGGMFDRGEAAQANAEYMYDGTLDDEYLPDYISGFHITDRP